MRFADFIRSRRRGPFTNYPGRALRKGTILLRRSDPSLKTGGDWPRLYKLSDFQLARSVNHSIRGDPLVELLIAAPIRN